MRIALPLAVLAPLGGAACSMLFSRRPPLQRAISILALTVLLVDACVLLWHAHRVGTATTAMAGWPAPYGIVLVADRLAALLLTVSAVVLLAVMVYGIAQKMAEDQPLPHAVFHPAYLVLAAGVAISFLTGDLFNLFVGFEVLLSASYVLLTVGGTAPRLRAGMTYVLTSLLSSLLFLMALAQIYAATGTLNLAQLALRLDALPDTTRALLEITLTVAFGIKAAVVPLAAWLPDSYPTAPAPVTAVFAGLLTKVGVYALIRTQTLLFTGPGVSVALTVLASVTMVVGILGAMAQSDLKRMLSFTLVSHIGFMLLGVGLVTPLAISGAVVYTVHHIAVQTALFLVTGLVEWQRGTTEVTRLRGLVRLTPLTALLYLVSAWNLAGIPPMSGFLGKAGLIRAALDAGTPVAVLGVAAMLLTSLLTLYVMSRVWSRAFWRAPLPVGGPGREPAGVDLEMVSAHRPAGHAPHEEPGRSSSETRAGLPGPTAVRGPLVASTPWAMRAATAALVALTLALTPLAGPLYALTDELAEDLVARRPYVEAVLPDAYRPPEEP
ncbi:Na+/H+ antiporter subunit D [Allostreptomyces psammosilenae]|uniref:Multicomponent Na+:H+ antiporter subunit D n=1 Tax=Allostreptomyces psammosilenae TaxID=1892865 RepID=A0A852ZPL9_9ACTN|nr:Na+/H+ antiporter subunit D [Allostreptomyces psammosilenae]NYI04309.1 multicomponent Na+:H+ antiporter subunit D [Allostreptomyces psammosilenae]